MCGSPQALQARAASQTTWEARAMNSDSPLWTLARQNADVLRISTLFTAQQVPKYLSDNAGVDSAIRWCKEQGVTHVYLESFRTGTVPLREVLTRARDRFREAGFLVSGCITPAGYGKRTREWSLLSCYTAPETLAQLREMSEFAASLFDEVMIDDFYATGCECEDCCRARGGRDWASFRCDLMLGVSRECILEPARGVNPKACFIIKYPCWHELFQERGYDVGRESELFPATWVGTETRGNKADGMKEPQYRAYWLMRWLLGIGGGKCGGGWYDTIDTDQLFYLEQARQTILGGARESFLFNFGALFEGATYDQGRGPKDAEALRDEQRLHFELARLVRPRQPRGLLGWKPVGSPPGQDWNLHVLLGMAGFPVTAAHEFDAGAPGFVFACHVLHDPSWPQALQAALGTGRPVVATPRFIEAVSDAGQRGLASALESDGVIVPAVEDHNHWHAVERMPADELDRLRDRATAGLGVSFHAPRGVGLYLFDDDVAVVERFRDEPTECRLEIEGWRDVSLAVAMPSGAAQEAIRPNGGLRLAPRSLVALVRQ
jgi:hypothetical protein